MNPWIEGVDYYINDNGLLVFTEKYLLERGYCCGNGCKHCPFNYNNVPEPQKSELIKIKNLNNSDSEF
ncbi:MAG: DUF5522 domain-containing protein [Chitinophagaceae bacterium]